MMSETDSSWLLLVSLCCLKVFCATLRSKRSTADKGQTQGVRVGEGGWWGRKQKRRLGRERNKETSMSESVRHPCWTFKTHCGGVENRLFTQLSNVQTEIRNREEKERTVLLLLFCCQWLQKKYNQHSVCFPKSKYNVLILKARVRH